MSAAANLAWFKVATSCYSDPAVLKLAHALKIHRIAALGLITAVEAQLTSFSPDGDFDAISEHLPALLDGGIPGEVLVAALRKAMANEDGYCESYLDRNAAAFAAAEKARLRSARNRARAAALDTEDYE